MIKKLRHKLILMCSVIILFVFGIGLLAVYEIKSINSSYSYLVHKRAEIMREAKTLVGDFEYGGLYLRSYLLAGYPDYLKRFQDAMSKTNGDLERLKALVDDNTGREMVGKIEKDLNSFATYSKEVLDVKHGGTMSEVVDYTLNKKGTINSIIQAGNDLADYEVKLMHQQTQENERKVQRIITTVILVVLLSIIVGLIISILFANNITAPVSNLEKESMSMAKGDLTGAEVACNTNDEVGNLARAFNHMKRSLKILVEQVSEASNKLSQSVQQLSAAAQETSGNAIQAATTINEMSATVDQVATSANMVAMASKETSELAEQGNKGIDKVTRQMDSLGSVSEEVVRVVSGLHHATNEISKIVDLITGIADQTNLLALNAAIEAARAGEQGRGFAVVAEEVRKLAEQSSASAKEIYRLIKSVQTESDRAMDVMNQSKEEVKQGQLVISELGMYFRTIIEKVQNLGDQIQDVAAAAQQMSAGVQNVAGLTEEQSASTEELSALAQQLAGMGVQLEEMTKRFIV